MASHLSTTAANRALDFLLGKTPTPPATPLHIALVTEDGEVSGGDYQRIPFDVPFAVDGQTANATDAVWTGLPACTITGIEIWDSGEPAVLLWQAPLDVPQAVPDGGELKLPADAVALRIG